MARNFDRIGIAMIVPVIALLAATVLVGTAHADPGNGHGNGPGNGKEHSNSQGKNPGKGQDKGKNDHDRHVVVVDGPDRDHRPDRVYIDRNHRDKIVRYSYEHHWRCPPGLIQGRYGCLPKGQTKKRYVVGRPLPSYVVIEPVPRELVVMLPPPPRGYIYRRVDGDVLLIAQATRNVLEAVVLLSAIH